VLGKAGKYEVGKKSVAIQIFQLVKTLRGKSKVCAVEADGWHLAINVPQEATTADICQFRATVDFPRPQCCNEMTFLWEVECSITLTP